MLYLGYWRIIGYFLLLVVGCLVVGDEFKYVCVVCGKYEGV